METSVLSRDGAPRTAHRWRRREHPLPPQAARVAADLRRDGIARTSVAELTGQDGLLQDVLDCAGALLAHRGAAVAAHRRRLAARQRPWGPAPEAERVALLGPDVPAGACRRLLAEPVLSAVVEASSHRAVRQVQVEAWLEVASPSPVPPRRWQRESAGRHPLVEVWVNLTGDEDGQGPLHYVRGTHRRGRRGGAGTFEAPGGPVGTVVLADLRGMHRRSPAVGRDRLLLRALLSGRRPARARPPVLSAELRLPSDAGYALAGA
ncbi:hypothetical protein [Kineococcus gypseus]|uniref:hypothetical protein n=1 Tax=Kineococcus gypseus TaxID=1637102 RepID=UPI003D7C4BDB